MPLLECRQLCKSFGAKRALNNVDLALPQGRITALLGPNGSGKTTLIKLASGLLMPDFGQILIDGVAPGPESKAIVSYLPDKNYLPDWMRVRDLMKLFSDFYSDFVMAKAADMLASLNISVDDRLKAMSKGTKEKVQLIMVMSRQARLYLLDEPIAGVDPATRDYILRTIITNYSENASVLISTHLISDVENVLDDVIFIQEGEIRLHKPCDELRAESGKSVDAVFREVYRC